MARALPVSAAISAVLCLATVVATTPVSNADAPWALALLALIAAVVTTYLSVWTPDSAAAEVVVPQPVRVEEPAPQPRMPEPVRIEPDHVEPIAHERHPLLVSMAAIERDPMIELVEGSMEVIDELTRSLVGPGGSTVPVEHVIWRLGEILQRADIGMIDGDVAFDGLRHRAVDTPGQPPAGAPIVETVAPGFEVGERVFLRASVRMSP